MLFQKETFKIGYIFQNKQSEQLARHHRLDQVAGHLSILLFQHKEYKQIRMKCLLMNHSYLLRYLNPIDFYELLTLIFKGTPRIKIDPEAIVLQIAEKVHLCIKFY